MIAQLSLKHADGEYVTGYKPSQLPEGLTANAYRSLFHVHYEGVVLRFFEGDISVAIYPDSTPSRLYGYLPRGSVLTLTQDKICLLTSNH